MSTPTVVRDQEELGAALAAKKPLIYIDSPPERYLIVAGTGSSGVEARGSSSVVARGSSSVVAWGSSRVVARESSRVEARESSSVEARESSSVEAWESSSVVAWESSSVVASRYVAVQRHPNRHDKQKYPTVTGGVIIDLPDIEEITDPSEWADYHGVKTGAGGGLLAYKGVDRQLASSYGTSYPVGETVTCPDWSTGRSCGGGLHFSPSPAATHSYVSPSRYLLCEVNAAAVVCLGDKVKSESCRVLYEVDVHGDRIIADASGAAR